MLKDESLLPSPNDPPRYTGKLEYRQFNHYYDEVRDMHVSTSDERDL